MKLRSLLFVPADSERKFAKASGIGADALILDLEDSVAPPCKALARDMVQNLLGGPPRDWAFLVRINPLGSDDFIRDVEAMVGSNPAGFVIPKPVGPHTLNVIDAHILTRESLAGLPALG